jgi:hypothetical protein
MILFFCSCDGEFHPRSSSSNPGKPAMKHLGISSRTSTSPMELLSALLFVASAVSAVYENQSQTFGCNRDNFYSLPSLKDNVYTVEGAPLGCNEQRGARNSEFYCDCECDLNAGMCDYNCCCDDDCSAQDLARFESSAFGCIHGENKPDFQQCYNAEAVNERYSMETTVEDGLLCVFADNADIHGTYLKDAGIYEGNTAIFDDPLVQKEFSYSETIPGTSINDRGTASAYYRGDPIRAASADGSQPKSGGYMALPTAGPDGQCIDSNYGHFMEPLRGSECVRVVENLDRNCGLVFDASRALMSVCSTYKTTHAGCANEWVEVEVGATTLIDPVSGSKAVLQDADLSSLSADYTMDGVCINAVTEACYYVYYGVGGVITKVIVDLTLTNITAAEPATAVRQGYSVEFLPAQVAADRSPSTKVLRTRSGNPGYIVGLPVLNAELITSSEGSAMNARVPGLKVYGSLRSPYCVESGMLSEDVLFGEDLVTGCTLQVSYDNFTDLCSQTGPNVRDFQSATSTTATGIPKFLWANASFDYLGTFGNADPLDVSQWMKMTFEGQPNSPSLDETEQSCSFLTTSLHIEILISKVGSTQMPQNKIIGARAHYDTERVVFSAEVGGTQEILLQTTVSFITMESKQQEPLASAPPPVLWSVPWDVFYPFF